MLHICDDVSRDLTSVRGHGVGLCARLRNFGRAEDGSLVVFGLFCLMMMLLLAGVGLDALRQEQRRVAMQNTLDSAVLAASDIEQTLEPSAVVIDYFTKAGLTAPKTADIKVTTNKSGTSRSVSVATVDPIKTWFINMVGVNSLNAQAGGAAAEKRTRVEISLVLDVSGSMNSGNRLVNLKPAAKNFVKKVLGNSPDGDVSISIIPYSTQVNAGSQITDYLALTSETTLTNCIEFETSDFANVGLWLKSTPVGQPAAKSDHVYQRNGYFDPFTDSTNGVSGTGWLPNCEIDPTRQILPFSSDSAALTSFIDGLTASGNTSIDIGLKWGTALLDPSTQPIAAGLAAAGKIDSRLADRPLAYKQDDVMKVLVVMTDGENTTEYKLTSKNNTGASPFYVYGSASDLNAYTLYWDRSGTDQDYYNFQINASTGQSYGWSTAPYDVAGDAISPTQMSWPEVLQNQSVWRVYGKLYWPALSTIKKTSEANKWYDASMTYVYSAKDALTKTMCSKVKAQDVVVYGIAFDAPAKGQALLQNCATDSTYYYSTTASSSSSGTDINTIFDKIAGSISKLKLTQ